MRDSNNIEHVSREVRAQKLINRTTFKYCTTYNENLCATSYRISLFLFIYFAYYQYT